MTTRQTIDLLKSLYVADDFQFEFQCSMYLAGDHHKELRQDIIKEITGELVPKNKAGLHKVSKVLKESFEQLTLF
jgi:hypothetical protein